MESLMTISSYEDGKSFAQEVQEQLRLGKGFADLNAETPEEVMEIIEEKPEGYCMNPKWWHGYLSVWD
jgi:hypothetical protein